MSKFREDVDEQVNAFLRRPPTGEWPHVGLGATYLFGAFGWSDCQRGCPDRRSGTTDGRRRIIGPGQGPTEAATFWMCFLRGLKAHDRDGSKPVVANAYIIAGPRHQWYQCSASL